MNPPTILRLRKSSETIKIQGIDCEFVTVVFLQLLQNLSKAAHTAAAPSHKTRLTFPVTAYAFPSNILEPVIQLRKHCLGKDTGHGHIFRSRIFQKVLYLGHELFIFRIFLVGNPIFKGIIVNGGNVPRCNR